MSTFVLVHGAWHGAWCWEKIVPLLEAEGHTVIAPDLPGSGEDKTSIKKISLKAYITCIGDIIVQQKEAVILVGHSMAGIVITQVAEYYPDKIKRLVYLSAFLPRNGEFFLYLAEKLPDGLVNANMLLSEDKRSTSVKQAVVVPAFYNDCDETDAQNALTRLMPQATAPLMSSVRISDENFGGVDKAYIICSKDQTLILEAQEMLIAWTPCDEVITLEAGHSSFFSRPVELCKALLRLVI